MNPFNRRLLFLPVILLAACAPTVQPPGPGATQPRFEDGRFIARDGQPLPLRVWPGEGPLRAALLALHGFNDYSDAFAEPAAHLVKQGIQIYAYDQRGFGAGAHAGIWPGRDRLVEDATDAARLVKARHPTLPVYFLGESMGGAIAMVALAGEVAGGAPPPVDGAILSAPAVWGGPFISRFRRGVLDFLVHTVPWFPLSAKGMQIQASDNEEALRKLGNDPLVLKVTRVDTLHGLLGLMDAAQEVPPRLTAPLLFLYGIKDEIIPMRPTLAAIDRLPADGKARIAVYANGYHLLLRDLQAGQVMGDIAAWVVDPGAPLPTGADKGGRQALEAQIKP